MAYNERGEEILDDTPIEVPLKFKRPPSIQEMIQMYVRAEMQVRGLIKPEDVGREEDFDVGDDAADDILTPYELHALAADMEASLPRKKKDDVKGEAGKKVESGRGDEGPGDKKQQVGDESHEKVSPGKKVDYRTEERPWREDRNRDVPDFPLSK